jgi:hypothetical protein
MYHNRTNHDVTVFLNNAVPVKFMAHEHKRLAQEGLEKLYQRFLVVVPDPADVVKEGVEPRDRKVEKGLINEVKQPEPNKVLTKEPVEESSKKGRKVIKEEPKVSEGYSPWQDEQTVASTGRQGKE